MTNFQRTGSISNAHIGRDFEDIAYAHFIDLGYDIIKDVGLSIGLERKKNHRFDLGTPLNVEEQIIIECKSHRWTLQVIMYRVRSLLYGTRRCIIFI